MAASQTTSGDVGQRVISLSFGEPLEILTQGTTRPIKCRLEDANGDADLWVVKLPSDRRPESLLAEAAASKILGAIDLPTPDIGFVELPNSPLFDDQYDAGRALNDCIRKHGGALAFCSRFVRDGVDFVRGTSLRGSTNLLSAATLFAFDAFAWHFDRTSTTPNLLWSGGQLVPIDHARCFHQIEAIDEAGCTLLDYEQYFSDRWRTHVMFEYLRRSRQRGRLTDETIVQAFAGIAGLPRSDILRLAASWPSGLGPLPFHTTLSQFLDKRLDLLDKLKEAVRAALAS